jgi:hypothetical protein
MTAENLTTIIYLYCFIAVVASIFIAFRLETRLKARLPDSQPYRWGFYIGCISIAGVPFMLQMLVAALIAMKANQQGVATECFIQTVYFAVQAVCGWFIIKRKRWAWAVGTAASFNIVLWIANGIYARNRWDEFVDVS